MSLSTRIIPCLDVKNNRVVKGVNFKDIIDAGDPVECAIAYNNSNADELVLLDITASLEQRSTWLKTVCKIADSIFIPFTIGGGISSVDDIYALLDNGADKISINSSAVANPKLITQGADRFGSQCIVVAMDVKQTSKGKWEVFTHGGTKATGIDAISWAKQVEEMGAGEILLTSMDTDGVKTGFDIPITKVISTNANIPVIASGGAGKLEHFSQGAIEGKADALLAASVFHFKELTINQVKEHMREQGINVRL
jgi:cyclase